MKLNIIIVVSCVIFSSALHAQNKLGKFSHLSKFSGSWDVELVYKDSEVRNLISKEFYLDLDKFRADKEDELSQIDVIKGNMILESYSNQNFCASSTFMSISLTDDDEVYLIMLRNSKVSILHTIFGERTRNMKSLRPTKEVTKYIRKILRECKSKSLQNI